ncbi:hypothetical protein [Hymenobacter sp. GOD-10R]|uniref:hypothetical protein n=1 Tax=Hymenobacter sp. GOD-10R TaxID=3093922 RepID=UPI002D7731B9|nr:hypothetical protein [Hymenobacter sp. GOD-10R]WRQ26925.1 hypothetical protein SD425_17775 [Hymenobacter sp. GOD-10R]
MHLRSSCFFLLLPFFNLAPAPNPLIAPGRSIGNITLGASPETLTQLGPAATSDAAMQKAWATWYGKSASPGSPPTQLDVYTAATGSDMRKTIQMVRATSPWFHTAGGLHTGSTLASLRQACGPFKLVTSYAPTPKASLHYIYDNAKTGIAFELDGQTSNSHCTAIIVHLPGKSEPSTYLAMTQYLKLVKQRASK